MNKKDMFLEKKRILKKVKNRIKQNLYLVRKKKNLNEAIYKRKLKGKLRYLVEQIKIGEQYLKVRDSNRK